MAQKVKPETSRSSAIARLRSKLNLDRENNPSAEELDNELETRRLDPVFDAFDKLTESTRGLDEETHRYLPTNSGEMYEREVRIANNSIRKAAVNVDSDSIVLGRMDLASSEVPSLTIGRMGLWNAEKDLLLVDWRAPQASRFFQVTSENPLDVRRKRIFTLRNRHVVDIDDEVFDKQFDDGIVRGQGGLLRALSRPTDGFMHDIVKTIQAEQDEIIRLDSKKSCVVQGAAGTGKTVVALHRVSYVMYQRAEELKRSGVLVVGPSKRFGEYISRVLPGLGETSVQFRALSSLVAAPPGFSIIEQRDPELAELKGRAELKSRLRHLAVELQPGPVEPWSATIGVTRIEISQAELVALRRRSLLHSRVAINNAARTLIAPLTKLIIERAGVKFPDRIRQDEGLQRELGYLADELLPGMTASQGWLTLSEGRVDLAAALRPTLTSDEASKFMSSVSASHLSVDDLPLLFWLDRHLGQRRPMPWDEVEEDSSALLAEVTSAQDRLFAPRHLTAIEDRKTFGLIVVDEAQDLTPMQWGILAAQGPSATWVIVGDESQSQLRVRRPLAGIASELPGLKGVVCEFELSINYRTPAEIADYVSAIFGRRTTEPTTPRGVGESPLVVRVPSDRRVSFSDIEFALEAMNSTGRIVVIGADESLRNQIEDRGIEFASSEQVKGLEWDSVILVTPELMLSASSEIGRNALYVALTRSTNKLALITSDDQFEIEGRSRAITEID